MIITDLSATHLCRDSNCLLMKSTAERNLLILSEFYLSTSHLFKDWDEDLSCIFSQTASLDVNMVSFGIGGYSLYGEWFFVIAKNWIKWSWATSNGPLCVQHQTSKVLDCFLSVHLDLHVMKYVGHKIMLLSKMKTENRGENLCNDSKLTKWIKLKP